MVLNEKSIPNNRIINSRESTLYIDKNIIYKIFKEEININQRIKVIKKILVNKTNYFPEIYDFVYKNSIIIGYAMKYYPNAIEFSQNMRFNFIKKKCLELIDIYLNLKNNYNLCYSDFHKGNVYINSDSILLLDIDSCAVRKDKNENITDKFLCDYVLKMLYKTIFFDYEIYFSQEERKIIRGILYENTSGEKIETIEDLRLYTQIVTKGNIKKVLKKLPYSIR